MSGPTTGSLTTSIPTRWHHRFDPRPGLRRVRDSGIAIVQIVVAATLAYWFAAAVLGHPTPLLAATVTVSSLGLVRDARPVRVVETIFGMLVGILVAELLLMLVGSGVWQLALSVTFALVIARFLSPKPSFAIAAAIQSIIVMALPVGVPFVRLLDGIVGGVAALLVTSLIPRNPLREAARAAESAFVDFADAANTIMQSLHRGSRIRAERGLEKARALQPGIDAWGASIESGLAVARISPFTRARAVELRRHERVHGALDLATRNLRVIARRALYLMDDGQSRPVVADIIGEILRGADVIRGSIADIALELQAREHLIAVAAHLDPREVVPDGSLGEQNLVAALRPLVVDLLVAAGMTHADARAAVPRI
ncbi:aromatic acid exporter family protein [Microbacterium sp. C7(2022)]|uniref:FUSC family protein n=1 Tax=Microbacterium sp. C7(2022) TaxID=2992759 RepID=UPI00237A9CA4|nr:FUSC family protein [Microbacterium sp. C7(2022)]MDE0547139.1 FUSC family protein [Microbacterium sp. C7(2022)]